MGSGLGPSGLGARGWGGAAAGSGWGWGWAGLAGIEVGAAWLPGLGWPRLSGGPAPDLLPDRKSSSLTNRQSVSRSVWVSQTTPETENQILNFYF